MVVKGAGGASVCVGCAWLRAKGPMQGTPSQMAKMLASPSQRPHQDIGCARRRGDATRRGGSGAAEAAGVGRGGEHSGRGSGAGET